MTGTRADVRLDVRVPHPYHLPTRVLEASCDSAISSDVLGDLCPPTCTEIRWISLWVAVPQKTIDEDDHTPPRKDDIRAPGEFPDVAPPSAKT